MESDNNKKELINILCSPDHSFFLLHLIEEEQGLFNHKETDVNVIG
jgi:hypothetical protein